MKSEMQYTNPDDAPILQVLDERMRVMVGPEDTGDELLVLTSTVPDGSGPGLHTHPSREAWLVLEGTVEFRTVRDGHIVKYSADAGGAVHAPAGAPHGYTARGGDARLLSIFTPGRQMYGFFTSLDALHAQYPDLTVRDPEFQRLLGELSAAHGLARFPDPDR